MNVEIISIGDELLIGRTINTNAAWLGERLSLLGFYIQRVTTISDTEPAIRDAVTKAYSENNVVIITGGLGPTNDDITKHVLCSLFNTRLLVHNEALNNIETFIRSRNGEMNQLNRDQALFPEHARFIPNYCGTASGMWFEHNDSIIISLPGVPFEMKDMMEHTVFPLLQENLTLPIIIHEHISTTGIAEAKLAEIIAPWEHSLPEQIKLAYLPSPGLVKLRITCVCDSKEEGETYISKACEELIPYAGEYIFGYGLESIEEIAGNILLQNNATISTAESCTGGYIAHRLTSVPGSSAYFAGSIVAYSNNIKTQELAVPEALITTHGAVSKEVVSCMAQACRKKFSTTYAIAVSGIAGPAGGSEEKPVGTVWIAIASEQETMVKQYNFGTDRERTITRTAITALNELRTCMVKKISKE